MLKRLALGLLKGALIGGAIGAAFHFGLGWTTAAGLLAYLIAMGSGASAGVLTGKPPWRHAAWIESLLKGVAGVGVGALAYWAASKWGSFALPFEIPGVPPGTVWTELPLVFSAVIGGAFGTLVELDNTDAEAPSERGQRKAATKVRVDGIEDAEVVSEPAVEAKRERKEESQR